MDKSPKEHFEVLRKRPAMYLGRKSLTAFVDFTFGYSFAMEQYAIEDRNNDPFLIPGEFHEWVRNWYKIEPTAKGWWNLILERTDSEETALDKFFELYDEFRCL